MKTRLRIKLTLKLWHSRIRRRLMGVHATHLLTDSYNGKILVPVEDFSVGKSLAVKGEYERAHIEQLARMVDSSSRVAFIGSHIGSLVIPIAKIAAEVVAIEANPDIFLTLQMNLLLNGCKNVRAIHSAAYDAPGKLSFVKNRHNSGGSKVLPPGRDFEYFYDSPEVVEVRADTVDHLLGDFRPTHVIVDIEGAEYRALAGMNETLASCGVLVLEFVPNHIEHIANVTYEDFIRRIPARFSRFRLFDSDRVVNRDALSGLAREVARDNYYGGADLVCMP
jgi:FkbM family methyltransferase